MPIPIYQSHAGDQDPWRYYYSPNRRDPALDAGWTFDGVAFYAYGIDEAQAPMKEVHRLVTEQDGKFYYLYLIDAAQIASAVSNGWTDEGGSFYAYTGADQASSPTPTRAVYRYTSNSNPFRYFYSLLPSLSPTAAPGWVAEGASFWVDAQDTPDAGNLI